MHAWLITNLQNSCLHHHSHWPTFYNKKLNFAYEILLSIVGGIPHQIWKYHHLKHHIHVNDKPIDGKTKDPVSVFLHGKNNEVQNFWLFCFKMTKEAFVKMVVFPKFGKQVNHTKQILEQLAFNFYFLSFSKSFSNCASVMIIFCFLSANVFVNRGNENRKRVL